MTNPMGTPYGRSVHAYNPYATGGKIYGGSSGPSHPTSGQVRPDGYVAREQRRSGLAQAILGRNTATTAASSPGPAPSQLGELVSRHPYSVLAREALARRRNRT